jgi:hypothetical protein
MQAANVIDFAAYRRQHLARQQMPQPAQMPCVFFVYWALVPVFLVRGFA